MSLQTRIIELAQAIAADIRALRNILPLNGVRSVQSYGAKGDGATDDSAAFQAAADAVGDGVVVVPPGNYQLRDVVVRKGTLFACAAGSSEVTSNATGTPNTAVRFRYNGSGGLGSRIFTFKAATSGQWIKGGGITGNPHLNGAGLCEMGIDAQSPHRMRFEVEASRFTQAGMRLSGRNGVLPQFCDVDLKYVWGTDTSLTGNSHGIIMDGNHPTDTGAWVGCTQHTVRVHGLIHNGNMIHMVGHCDNNHLILRASKGTGTGTGYTLAIYPGNGGKAGQVNHIYYASNDIYISAESFGNIFHFTTSESLRVVGTGVRDMGKLISYTDGKVYSDLTAPLTEIIYIPATEMHRTGAASLVNIGRTPTGTLPESGNAGLSCSRHNPIWGAGRVSEIVILYRTDTGGSGDASVTVDLTTSAAGSGLASYQTLTRTLALTSTSVTRHVIPIVPARALSAAGIVGLMMERKPADAADTSANPLHILGVVVRIDFDGPPDMDTPMPAWREKL